MTEPVSLVLNFLRQHNFEKAEEALRSELQARKSFARPAHIHGKVDVASSCVEGFPTYEEFQCSIHHLAGMATSQKSQLKQEYEAVERTGITKMQHNQTHAYTEWEFMSGSNQDCVLEFKKKDACQRTPSPEISSSTNYDRQDGMEILKSCNNENGIGRRTRHGYKHRDFIFDPDNGTVNEQTLSQNQQQDFGSTFNHSPTVAACESDQPQQDLNVFELKSCTFVHEPIDVFQKAEFGLKALSPHSKAHKAASSAYNSFPDTRWLDHGVADDDAPTTSNFTNPFLHPLPTTEVFEQQEEKQVVNDCANHFKALVLEDENYSADLFKDISLPWEMDLQPHFAEEKNQNEIGTQDCYNMPSSNSRPTSGNFRGFADNHLLDKIHTNVLFEPSFNLGSFLDIPVGQEIASPGGKQKNGVYELSCSQNVMQDTPELLSGFATLGDEPTDPGMGYCKEYWDLDTYEDDEDPGYDRREIEDEDWFLANEIIYPNEDYKVKAIKEKMGEDILSQSNGENGMVQEKEDLALHAGGLPHTGGTRVNQAKLDLDIPSIATLLGHKTTNDGLTLKQIGNMSFDSHLMDAEELKFIRAEPVWQSFSSQMEKPLHYAKEDGHCLGERILRTDTHRKILTQGTESKGDLLHENNAQCDNAFDQTRYHDNQAVHGYSHFSKHEDTLSCPATLDVVSINDCIPVSMGDFFNLPASNLDLSPSHYQGTIPSSQGRNAEMPRHECDSIHWNEASHELSPVSVSENETSSSPALYSHPKMFNNLPIDNDPCDLREGEIAICTNDGSVSEPVVDGVETNALQEEAQLAKTQEDDYEIFNLRIIHRKNRTGFEEEKHFQVVLDSVVAGRYLITEYLGSAAFSKAVQARDLQTGMDVCMKIIKNNKDFFDQSLDEIKLLKYINKNDPADKHHLLRLYDYFYHREHLFIVCELLRANLYEFHKFNRESGGEIYFTMSRLQSITRQCLEALEFLHDLGLIHCDLKPENILIKSYSRCEIKVIDFGSSCFQTDHLCSYVQSRSYRAPEVIMGLPYDQKIDIWSLGCILAELCSGNVLFQNDSLATLLARVVGIIEPIMPDMIFKGKEAHKYFTKNLMLYERNQDTNKLEYLIPKRSSLRHRLPTGDQGFVDFVGYLLQVNPENRPSASEALKHPWLTQPYEPVC